MKPHVLIEPARPAERTEAFRFAFQHLDPAEQLPRIATALELVEKNEFDPAGVLVARRGGQLVGAVICMTTPGAGGLIWPPQVAPAAADRAAIEDELTRFALLWLRQRGAKLAQCLLAPAEAPLGGPLERNGLPYITALCYLRRNLQEELPAGDGRLRFAPYVAQPQLFGETLLRTYEATRDCPELTGARTLPEILEGHRAQGEHDPARWWLALAGPQPVGVLLMTGLAEYASWDVSYVGVVPSARQQGFGRQMMLHALGAAARAGLPQVTLSVDDRNAPAWALYRTLGFEEFDRRAVYLKVWPRA